MFRSPASGAAGETSLCLPRQRAKYIPLVRSFLSVSDTRITSGIPEVFILVRKGYSYRLAHGVISRRTRIVYLSRIRNRIRKGFEVSVRIRRWTCDVLEKRIVRSRQRSSTVRGRCGTGRRTYERKSVATVPERYLVVSRVERTGATEIQVKWRTYGFYRYDERASRSHERIRWKRSNGKRSIAYA